VRVLMENGLRPRFQLQSDHRLSDSVSHRGNSQHSGTPAMRLRYLHRPHRRRKIGPRRHPIPDLVEVAPQILLEVLDRLPVHPGCTLVRLDALVRLPHQLLRYLKRLVCRTRLAHSSPPRSAPGCSCDQDTDEPAPSLHPHYKGFSTTTSWSASAPRIGTRRLTVSAARRTPSRTRPHPWDRTQYRPAPSRVPCRSHRIGLTPPACRTPPGQ